MSNFNQDQLHLALNAARMGTWDWDVPNDAMHWCERMHALFGLAPGSFGGRQADFLNLLHAEDRPLVAAAMTGALESGAEYDGEFRVLPPGSGEVHILRARANVRRDEHGRPAHLIGVCWDVTSRRAEEQVSATERQQLSMLMDNLPDCIYFKDLDNRFIAVNHAMARHSGRQKPADLIGKNDFDLFAAEHARGALEDEREILRTGQPIVNLEEKETWPDGHVSWASTTKMPLRDAQGRLVGTFGLSRDITHRKRAEEQLSKIAEELRARNEALEEDLEMARELQNSLLPQRYPRFPRAAATESDSAVHFYHFYQPSTMVSGDFFDVLEISDQVVGLFICDVMGHGVRAAMVAAMIRALVSELRPLWTTPAEFLVHLNRALCDALKNARIALFASAFFVVADLARGELHYANAGHPHPFLVHHGVNGPGNGHAAPALSLNGAKPGPALGLLELAEYRNSRCALSPHDLLLLFTDGLFEVESRDGQLYSYRQLLGAVGRRSHLPTPELCRGVVEEIQQFAADREFMDDVCLVAMEIDRLNG